MREKFILSAAIYLLIYLFIYSWETTKALVFILVQKRFFFFTTACHEKEKNIFSLLLSNINGQHGKL